MPRRAHRRCKTQGPTCNGVAHPGFDNCARCLNDVIRPHMREEKAAVRARREKHELSKSNRDLITTNDLKEPQMAHSELDSYLWPQIDLPEPSERLTVEDAVIDVLVDRKVDERIEDAIARGLEPAQMIGEMLTERVLKDALYEEQPVLEAIRDRTHKPRLTPERRKEIADAYILGMPVEEICTAWGIGNGTLYHILHINRIPKRQIQIHPTQENPMPDKSSPPVSAQKVAPASVNGLVSGLPEWTVTYTVMRTETTTVAAASFNDAAAAVNGEGIEVVSVARSRA